VFLLSTCSRVARVQTGQPQTQLLPELFREMTDELGVGFVDLAALTAYSDLDARHLDAEGHAAVGHATARAIGRLS
jgi:hypothetical protein